MRRRVRERGSSNGGTGILFPIGVGLGALVAIALFLGFRSGTALDGGTSSPLAVRPADGTGKLPDERPAKNAAADAATIGAAGGGTRIGGSDAVATAPAGAEGLADDERLAVLDALADPAGESPDGRGVSGASGLPSADDPETTDLFGGRIVMVSSAVPRVIVLADGTNLVPGETLPSGHRIIGIERERILLERDGAEWRVRVP